uniref:Uncharacterized protein n=1 Tax=Anguilla anguilla TaxID=7936 RepID=A0A0E9TIC8_ANGAN
MPCLLLILPLNVSIFILPLLFKYCF